MRRAGRSGLEGMRRAGRESGGSPIPPRQLAEDHARLLLERTSAEHHAKLAMLLWQGADAMGKVVKVVDDMGRDGYQAVADEELAADRIVIDGPEIARALRTLAMRLDRSVMVQAGTDD